MKLKNKKAQDAIIGAIMFIVLNVFIFLGILFLISRAGATDGITEKIYARQIALAVENLKPGTELTFRVDELFDKADKNSYGGEIFFVDYGNSRITVKLSSDGGHSYSYFNLIKPGQISWDKNKKIIIIKA